jgi:GntR family transcriptional regulator
MKNAASLPRQPFHFKLDLRTGVPVYRQIMDQVRSGLAAGSLSPGDQLPTVRQMAVDLAINPNTVFRAYRELELGGLLETQQGTGTFLSHKNVTQDEAERQRELGQLVGEFVSRAGSTGFTVEDLLRKLHELVPDTGQRR